VTASQHSLDVAYLDKGVSTVCAMRKVGVEGCGSLAMTRWAMPSSIGRNDEPCKERPRSQEFCGPWAIETVALLTVVLLIGLLFNYGIHSGVREQVKPFDLPRG
jgi:hypothetical protein